MEESGFKNVAVFGAGSQIGKALLDRLEARKINVFRVRQSHPDGYAGPIHLFDAQNNSFNPPLESVDAIISLAPLPTIGIVIKMAEIAGAKRVIAMGSTGTMTKADSSSAIEQDFVLQQKQSEQLFREHCDKIGIAWTLFRPTMIYGAGKDQNVAFIKTMIRRFGFYPLPYGAKGKRQPVHYDDLAAACVAALECESTCNKAYNLGGGEILEYPEMLRRIFRSESKTPILLPVPKSVLFLIIAATKKLSKNSFVRKEMVTRMFRDLTVDNEDAFRDFGYRPRAFLSDENC